MLKAEHARQQKETPIILKTRGLKICKKEYLSKEYPYFVGYVEDSANQRVKVLVSEKILKPGQTDSNFKSNLIWDKAKNWYICEYPKSSDFWNCMTSNRLQIDCHAR